MEQKNFFTERGSSSFVIYQREIRKFKPINPEEEVRLAKLIKEGNQNALHKLVNTNLRFAFSVAKKYQNQGLSLPDLVNEGNLGLIKAAQCFDDTRGFKFISYAVWKVRASIREALDEYSLLIRVPANKLATLKKIKKFSRDFYQEYQRDPTKEEIINNLNLEDLDLDKLVSHGSRHVSLDAPIIHDSDEKESTLLDLLPSNDEIKNEIEEDNLKEILKKEISKLPEKEKKVIEMSFFQDSMSNKEIGSELGMSNYYVELYKKKALQKLRKRLNKIETTF